MSILYIRSLYLGFRQQGFPFLYISQYVPLKCMQLLNQKPTKNTKSVSLLFTFYSLWTKTQIWRLWTQITVKTVSLLTLSPKVCRQQSIQNVLVAIKTTNMFSFKLQVGIGNDQHAVAESKSLKVTKELLQGPIVIYFCSLHDAIRGRCFLSNSFIYIFSFTAQNVLFYVLFPTSSQNHAVYFYPLIRCTGAFHKLAHLVVAGKRHTGALSVLIAKPDNVTVAVLNTLMKKIVV